MANARAARLDWSGLMRAGLHGLGLTPTAFWALTPVELMLMLGRAPSAPGMTRAGLADLMARFPDAPRQPGSRPAKEG